MDFAAFPCYTEWQARRTGFTERFPREADVTDLEYVEHYLFLPSGKERMKAFRREKLEQVDFYRRAHALLLHWKNPLE